jgi:hypothetical protein
MLLRFPLLAFGLAFFSLVNFTNTDAARPWYNADVVRVPLMSGDLWHISGGHMFLLCSMALLFVELLRATGAGNAALVNHAFSVLVLVSALILFLTCRGYGNSIFFIYVSMTALDVMAGVIISVVTARRDITLQTFGHRH